jgi:hypothetical protein
MREYDEVAPLARKLLVTRGACRRFKAVAATHIGLHGSERDTAGAANAPAERRPAGGIRAQLVVHVQCGEPDTQTRGQPLKDVEQRHGVDATAQSHDEMVSRLDQARELRRNTELEICRNALTAAPLP